MLGIAIGQAILYGPSLAGKKILLPLDLLAIEGSYLPHTEQTKDIVPHNVTESDLILGLEPAYQLERLSGRYSSVEAERSAPRTVHALAEEHALDFWSLARHFPAFTPGVDAYYGTATYLPMADGARFRVTLSRDALVARPVNEPARQAVGDWGSMAQ